MLEQELFFVVRLREGVYLLIEKNHPEDIFNPALHFPDPLIEGKEKSNLLLPYFAE